MVTLASDMSIRIDARPEFDIGRKVDLTFNSSGIPQLRNVTCESQGQVVFLRGQVDSFYLKQLAQETVKRIAPNHRIVNLLVVS